MAVLIDWRAGVLDLLTLNHARLIIVSHLDLPIGDASSRSNHDRTTDGRRLRILAVGDVVPWPARDGYRLRFSSVLEALSDVGEIDLFLGVYAGQEDTRKLPSIFSRHEVVVVPKMNPSRALVLLTTRSQLPSLILWREWDEARARIRQFVRGPYDLVWYSHADTFVALGDPSFGPAVVDLDNLVDHILQRSFSPSFRTSNRAQIPIGIHHLHIAAIAKWALNQRDRILWARLQRSIAKKAATTVVCSEVDRQRLRANRVAIIPNSYADPGPPSGPLPNEPNLVMVATFTYQPNLDGAHWFAHQVLPELRRLVPDVKVRLVGRYDERLAVAALVPGVEIVGEVEMVGPELRNARGAVIPLLNGSGTRIKVLEAFAYALPVVTTEIGCEGLGITAGRHALVQSDPLAFAAACAQILTDESLCEGLRQNGRSFFVDHYRTDTVAAQIRRTALGAAH